MIEAPEALFLSDQLNQYVAGKVITGVIAGQSPHKFTFFYGNPQTDYPSLLCGKTVGHVYARGGMVDLTAGDVHLVFTDGANLRLYAGDEKIPVKHQLLLIFGDNTSLAVSVRMYGGILCFREGCFDAPIADYYQSAVSKPQVMSDEFGPDYFRQLICSEAVGKKSVKEFLATGQTIPGLGNGVLQDILFNARIHPKTKIEKLSQEQKDALYACMKDTLAEIYRKKGRNTESDLFGHKGDYIPSLSKDTAGKECPRCDSLIRKENYLGGSIYYCSDCQKQP